MVVTLQDMTELQELERMRVEFRRNRPGEMVLGENHLSQSVVTVGGYAVPLVEVGPRSASSHSSSSPDGWWHCRVRPMAL